MKPLLYLLLILSSINGISQTITTKTEKSPSPYLQLSINKSFGFESSNGPTYYHPDLGDINVVFSPGGGMGMALEGGLVVSRFITLGLNANHQWIYNGGSYNNVGIESSASVSMQKFTLYPKIDFSIIENADFVIERIELGLGPQFNFISDLTFKQNDDKAVVDYQNNIGWRLNLNFVMDYFNSDKGKAVAGIGYHNSQTKASVRMADPYYQILDASGLEFYFGVRRNF